MNWLVLCIMTKWLYGKGEMFKRERERVRPRGGGFGFEEEKQY